MNPLKVFRMLLLTGAVLLFGLTACGGGDPGGPPLAAQSSAPTQQDSRQAWLDVAKCMREHGYPNFPDPVQSDRGVWYVSTDIGGVSPPECDQLVRSAKQATAVLNALSAQEMERLRAYAKCIREHAVPNFPDPDEEGNFELPQGMDDALLRDAQTACKQYAPTPRPK